MWLKGEEMSKWAYRHCRDMKDIPEVRKLITDSQWAYYYCILIKDRPEIGKYIKVNECG